MRKYKVAIAGATGAVGREMIKVLEEREFPVGELVPLASERSEGQQLEFGGDAVVVRRLKPDSFAGVDIALFSPGATVSREFAPHAARAGAVVIDNSSAFRMEPDCPLVVPEVNPRDVELALKPGGPRARPAMFGLSVRQRSSAPTSRRLAIVRRHLEQRPQLYGSPEPS